MTATSRKFILGLLVMFLAVAQSIAQRVTISGKVSDNGEPAIGVSVGVSGTTTGTVTDINGKYSLQVNRGNVKLVYSGIGYVGVSRDLSVSGDMVVDVELEASNTQLGEVVISVGSRNSQRTITDSPLPIDVLSNSEIRSTGQLAFDRALQYRVPSFNTVQTPVNDATSLLDPYEIRNMGPSRTLVLINGKRKNMSSLVYIQTSPGRGEGGADISAIPTDAIQRIEILRDGASAQYGSDAIAGVMNIILKDRAQFGTATLRSSITTEGDGGMLGFALNNGATFGERGFLNYTVDLSRIDQANRPGTVDAQGEFNDFLYANPETTDINGDGAVSDDEKAQTIQANADGLASVQDFLKKKPDAGNVNGDPAKSAAKFLVNFSVPVGGNVDFYGNAAYVYKKVNSFANYRTPYWRGPADNPYAVIAAQNNEEYLGYVPTFEGDLSDYNGTVGFRKTNNGWVSDISFTTGGNKQLYTVDNSRNRSLGLNSPLRFKPGGYEFTHNVGNIDLQKMLRDNLNFSIGSEFRQEKYTVLQGDTSSYVGTGADSFPGTTPDNASENTRYNYGGYAGLALDVTDNFLVDATVRAERYSDFGNAFVYKVSSRYKFSEKATLRASYSTGFRAPQLHQIYLQTGQQSFVPGQGIQTKGLFNNNSAQAKLLGIPKLKAEESTNITVGVGLKPTNQLSITLDYYNIAVDDRIILGSEITGTGDPNNDLDKILNSSGIVAASFWTNAIDTRTSGIDFVANYRNVMLGRGKMAFNLAGNYTINNNLRDAKSRSDYESGDISVPNGAVNNPRLIANAGKSVFDYIQDALLFSSRPKYKAILGIDYGLNKWSFNLNNTLFGPTTFRQAGLNPNLKTVFKPNVVTDLGLGYQLGKNIDLNITVQNLLNRLPKWEFKALNATGEGILADPAKVKTNSNAITFNQRYAIVTYDGSQFSQLGTTLAASLSVRF